MDKRWIYEKNGRLMIVWEVPIKTPNGRKRAGRVIYIKRLYKYKKNITSDKTYD